jgi:hypothetical protein
MHIKRSLAIALTTMGVLASIVTPAQADVKPSAFSDCPAGYGCLFSSINGGGLMYIIPACGMRDIPYPMGNNTESVVNRGGGSITLYDGTGNTGANLGTYVNDGVGRNLPSSYRNRASSLIVYC